MTFRSDPASAHKPGGCRAARNRLPAPAAPRRSAPPPDRDPAAQTRAGRANPRRTGTRSRIEQRSSFTLRRGRIAGKLNYLYDPEAQKLVKPLNMNAFIPFVRSADSSFCKGWVKVLSGSGPARTAQNP